MSKYQTVKAIRTEIDRLNQEIDLRIIRGVSYRQQALRHKFLIRQLDRLIPRRSWFSRLPSFVSAFMF